MARSVELELDITSDSSKLDVGDSTRELKKLGEAADDAKRELADVGDIDIDVETDKARRALERLDDRADDLRRQLSDNLELGIDDRDVIRDLKRVESDYKALKRSIERNEVEVEVDADKGMRRAGGAVQEFKQESIQNFSEVTSSFDGSMESIGDLAQGTFGGLASGLADSISGIKGILAGLGVGLVGAGIGLAIGEITRLGEAAEESREQAADLAEEALDTGEDVATIAAGIEAVTDSLLDLSRQSGRGLGFDGNALRDLADDLEVAGLSATQFGELLGDGPDAIKGYIAELEALNEAVAPNQRALNNLTDAERGTVSARKEVIAQLETYVGELDDAAFTQEFIDEATRNAARSMEDYADELLEAAGAADSAAGKISDLYDILAGDTTSVTQAQDDLRASTRELNGFIEENGNVLFARNEKGEKARDLLVDMRDETFNLLEAEAAQGATQDELIGIADRHNEKLLETADMLNLDAEETRKLVEEYGLVPEDVSTAVELSGVADAKREADEVATAVDNIPDSHTTTIYADTTPFDVAFAGAVGKATGGVHIPELTPGGRTFATAPAAQPINLVRVSIAGQEVEAQVGRVAGRQRRAAEYDQLLGVGGRP